MPRVGRRSMAAMWKYVAYQEACRSGFDAERCVEEEVTALEGEKKEIEGALEEGEAQNSASLQKLYAQVKDYVEMNPALSDLELSKKSVKELRTLDERARASHRTALAQLGKLEEQNRLLKEKMEAVRRGVRGTDENGQLPLFIKELGERTARQIAKRKR